MSNAVWAIDVIADLYSALDEKRYKKARKHLSKAADALLLASGEGTLALKTADVVTFQGTGGTRRK